MNRRNISYVLESELANQITSGKTESTLPVQEIGPACDVVVAFGGDGTILAAAQFTAKNDVPILGVNIGTLGFLTEIVTSELEDAVERLISGNYSTINRMALSVQILGNSCRDEFLSLNDVVLDKGASSRLIYIDAYVDGLFLNSYRADGLIVSTPTGSTAYSMSAGGPLMVPEMHAVIVTPICPHSVTMKPIIISCESSIELSIRPEAEHIQLNIDGQNKCDVHYTEKVKITRAAVDVPWISIGMHDFYDILRTKLNWGAGQPTFETERQP
ncbi:MAG: NAD(+)/NADH kinase [candidate division KSB1 bacterium]|nr:NAD(+)/NADH kinase [candidate division KSB1 bacterium]